MKKPIQLAKKNPTGKQILNEKIDIKIKDEKSKERIRKPSKTKLNSNQSE